MKVSLMGTTSIEFSLELILKLEIALSNIEESGYSRSFRTGSKLKSLKEWSMHHWMSHPDEQTNGFAGEFETTSSLIASQLQLNANRSDYVDVCDISRN